MHFFQFPELFVIQLILIVVSSMWFLRRNDEIPILISILLFYVASYRYLVVDLELDEWMNAYATFGLYYITDESALSALHYIVLGQLCLLASYMLRQREVIAIVKITQEDDFFLKQIAPKVFLLGLLLVPVSIFSSMTAFALVLGGQTLAYGLSYLFLFPLALIGSSTLVILLWKFNGLASWQSKGMAILILVSTFYVTFQPTSRFQFIGLLVAAASIWFCSYSSKTRMIALSIISVGILALFAIAGTMRYSSELQQTVAWERFYTAEDANMLDGFVMVQDVYPELLDFRYGMEHLEILARPIPRVLWPDKPVGGYVNKLGLYNVEKHGTLGFSPTLFGSFYAEGGAIAIILFSLLYGAILAALMQYSNRLSYQGILIRAVVICSLIPLLRGGDLPGIYAWIGMAFWPVFLVLWLDRKRLKAVSYSYSEQFFPNLKAGCQVLMHIKLR
ncbi:MAG: O-antigen polymerase [Pseudomonadota bacterium]